MNNHEKLSPPNAAYRELITANDQGNQTPSAVENALANLRQIEDPQKRLGLAVMLKTALSDEIEAIKISTEE